MLNRTNKEKCMFQHNEVKAQNMKDTKNALKAFRGDTDQVHRKIPEWQHVF